MTYVRSYVFTKQIYTLHEVIKMYKHLIIKSIYAYVALSQLLLLNVQLQLIYQGGFRIKIMSRTHSSFNVILCDLIQLIQLKNLNVVAN